MSSPVEQIKEKLGIVDVVGSYVTLEKAGANYKAKCPFHNEKTASFFVSPERNSYYCFGCGAKGDILSFVQEFEGLDFIGALRVLAKRAGVELRRENAQERTEREKLYLMMEHATLFFQRQLAENAKAKEYLAKRGLTVATVKAWRLGYAPVEWRALGTYLSQKGFTGAEMEKVGLVKKSEKVRNDFYDRFRGRIIFPIFDSSGRVVAYSGRQFESDGTEAKYLNSPETPLFEKSKILYGYDKAKLEIRKRDYSLLVEGQMDLLMSHQAGFANAVASSGTALTIDQLEILRRLSNKVVIAYDGDEAGGAAAARGWELALALGMEVSIAVLPEGKDPADIVLENPKVFEKAITEAKHIIVVELDRIVATEKDHRKLGLRVQKEVLPYVAEIQSAIEKSHFMSEIAYKSGIKESVLWEEEKKIEAKKASSKTAPVVAVAEERLKRSRRSSIERMLLGLLFWQEKQKNPGLKLDIKQEICDIISPEGFEEIRLRYESVKDELIFEAEVSWKGSADIAQYAGELLRNLKEEHLREEFSAAMLKLQKAERDKNQDEVHKLLSKCQKLSEMLREMRSEQ